MPLADPDRLRAELRPFEEAELALVRAVVSRPPWISEPDENALRYALNLARAGLALRRRDSRPGGPRLRVLHRRKARDEARLSPSRVVPRGRDGAVETSSRREQAPEGEAPGRRRARLPKAVALDLGAGWCFDWPPLRRRPAP